MFNEIGLVEIGCCISDKLRMICPKEYDTNQIQKFFYDEENSDFIRQAIFLGLGESNTLKKAKSISQELSQLSSEFSQAFPVFRVCAGIMSAYNTAIVNTVSSGHIIDKIFQDVRERKDVFEPQSEEYLFHPDLVFRQMGVYVTVLHTDFTNNYATKMLEQIEEITEVLSEAYESRTDRQLRKLSKKEQSNVDGFLEKGNSVPDSQQAFFEYLKFYKTVVSHEQWDNIVESKTLLEVLAPGENE